MDSVQLTDTESAFLGGTLMGALPFLIIGFIVYYLLLVFAWWNTFKKAGEPGWKAIIPIYNVYVMYKLSWKPSMFWVYIVLDLVSQVLYYNVASDGSNDILRYVSYVLAIILLVVEIIQLHKLSKAFGHGAGFTIGLIIFNPIFMLILGYGASQYKGHPDNQGQLEA